MKGNKSKLTLGYILIVLFLGLGCSSGSPEHQQDLQLWYDGPSREWTQALPVGNGSLGGMIFGGVSHERIQLNEESVWTGHPIQRSNPEAKMYLDSVRNLLFAGNYEAAEKLAQQKIMGKRLSTGTHTYQTLGNLYLNFPGSDSAASYQRSLDLQQALARVSYQKKGVSYKREFFSSYPDQVMAIKISADELGKVSLGLQLNRPSEGKQIAVKGNQIVMREHVGNGDGVRFTARLQVKNDGGRLVKTDSTIQIKHANEVVLLLTAATDYEGENPDEVTAKRIKSAMAYSFGELKLRHVEDYQRLFDRVSLDLTPDSLTHIPTDQRLEMLKKGTADAHLVELYFQYGRYLLISSSRPGSLPANLQGLWARGMSPPWNADYHANINLQMNYWPAEVTNLSESAYPLFDFVEALNKRGQNTAREMYGARGMVVHHTTDAWHFTSPIGRTYYGMWPMGGAWLSMHFWEHYKFTKDTSFLRNRAYPQLKAAALFFVDYLVEDPNTGYLVTGPSMSPENQFVTPGGNRASVTMGPTMDIQIVNELFAATIKASELLGIDPAFRDSLQQLQAELAPTQLGKDGTIMEWRRDFEEANPGHRHISHLYSLYPGNAIHEKATPDLFNAAQKTIERRLQHGGGHTGWSRAWIINFFARLGDGDKSHDNLLALFRKSTLPNLFDTHPPFQIDGNFGATAAVAEMLLQSHAGYIELLPAVPDSWPKGEVKGLKARGDVTVDISWAGNKLKEAILTAKNSGTYLIRYKGKEIERSLESDGRYTLGHSEFE